MLIFVPMKISILIAAAHQPVDSHMPASFAALEKWSKFFFSEPGLHAGVNL
jgi:hypothetical protein